MSNPAMLDLITGHRIPSIPRTGPVSVFRGTGERIDLPSPSLEMDFVCAAFAGGCSMANPSGHENSCALDPYVCDILRTLLFSVA